MVPFTGIGISTNPYMPWGERVPLTIGSERDVDIKVPGIASDSIVKIAGTLVMHPKTLAEIERLIQEKYL